MASVVLTGASWVSVLGLWCAAASGYINPAHFRIASVMGIAFPLMLGGTVFCFFLSLLFAPRRSWICLLGLVLSAGSIRSYIPINPWLPKAEEDTLRLMSYNAHSFPDGNNDRCKRQILEYLCNQQADIICFQEGNNSIDKWTDLYPEFAKRYPHHAMPYDKETTWQSLYSRYPIVRHELVTTHTQNGVVAFWVVRAKGDTLLVVNTHLQSNNLTPEDRTQYTKLVKDRKQSKQHPDSTLLTSRHLAGKIASSAAIRASMADSIADFLSRHASTPTIVCGDFNDTPISYPAYRMKSAGLNDAFRMAGNGMGRSFNKDAILVRIDHQFCSDHLRPIRAEVDNTSLWSDHYPLIVTYNTHTP